MPEYILSPIGVLRSSLTRREDAPRQGSEGAPDAWLEVAEAFAEGLAGLAVGDDLIVITWLHKAQRDTLQTHPRNDRTAPLTGIFATRSPDRPNPLGLHRVTVREIAGTRLKVGPIEAIDGTPIVDIKPALAGG
jgi:tRNA-Thr(GGU) m(6)t(6)A37 methyltransferase TsaA